ncbi:Conserved_hypothetical protein [Hexamita inflata]|uniref:Transmembrane protein n=1 Tax=Hexamita inflata TaxID=28002 RepID=A0AA86P9G5_9EUKA|nr:Conserved hypothetical protein [Hexamita inflata]
MPNLLESSSYHEISASTRKPGLIMHYYKIYVGNKKSTPRMNCLVVVQLYSLPNRQSLVNCYSTQSTLEFSRNLMHFVVHLESTANSACKVFPIGVKANLTLMSPSFDNITITTVDFSYEKTTSLLFNIPYALTDTQIDELETEQLAYLTIYSFSEITTLELMIFEETLSQLSECFSSINVTLQFNGFLLEMVPTDYCNNQMKLEAASPDNFIEQISLMVFESRFLIPVAQIVPHYTDALITYQYTTTDSVELQDLMTLQQTEFLTSTLNFDSNQGGVMVEFVFDVQNIFYQTIQNTLKNPVLRMGEDSFFIVFDEIVLTNLGVVPDYNSFSYKLSIEKGAEKAQFAMTYTEVFSAEQFGQIIQFDCHEINEKMEADCMKFYSFDEFDHIIIDLVFQQHNVLVDHCKEEAVFVKSPWKQAFAQVSNTQLCVTPSFVTGVTDYQIKYKDITLSNPSVSGNQYCFKCLEQCKDFKEDSYYVFGDATDVIITAKLFHFEYSQVVIQAAVIGVLIIIASVVQTVMSMIKTSKMIKQMKKKRNQANQ